MKHKILEIINEIRESNSLPTLDFITEENRLREDLGLTSFDLAELTVRIEDETDIDIFDDGLITTVGQIYQKLNI